MESCLECGFCWTAPLADLLRTIETCAERIAQAVRAVDATTARTRPTPHVWSALEYTVHTGDAIGWYDERIERILTEDHPRFTAFDWNAACDEREYNDRPIDLAVEVVGRVSAGLVARARRLAPDEWKREGIGSDGSKRSIDALLRRAAHEAVHHVADIHKVLTTVAGATTSDRAAADASEQDSLLSEGGKSRVYGGSTEGSTDSR